MAPHTAREKKKSTMLMATIEVRSPYDGTLVGTVPEHGPEDVSRAVAAAVGALDRDDFPRPARIAVLERAAASLAERVEELPRNHAVVAYCRGRYCVLAHDAVRLLNAEGLKASRATDGILEWRLAGVPIEASAA